MTQSSPVSSRRNPAGWALTLVLCVLLVAVLWYLLRAPFSGGNLSVSGYCGNLSMGGAVTDYRGEVYYAGTDGLYSVNENGSSTKVADGKISHVNVEKNRVYYLCDGKPTVLKNMVAVVRLSEVSCRQMSVNGSWIYYTDMQGKLYKMNTDGGDLRRVGEVTVGGTFAVDAGYVYYTDAQGLWKIRTNGLSETRVLLTKDCTSFFAYDRYVIYYQGTDGVYSMNADDGGTPLKRADSDFFNYAGGKLVYGAEDGLHIVDYARNAAQEVLCAGIHADEVYLTTGDTLYYRSGQEAPTPVTPVFPEN